jgi:hypothetical protein
MSDVEIRQGPDPSTIDEVVATGVDFHIEQMSDNGYWFCLSRGEDEWHFWIGAKRSKVRLTCSEQPGDAP